ncbi:hypothetical protein EDB81DRAFT_826693 [Dactylonectria macrodidyma]|uniref:Uncharacterized protein n=1 Tax=Dactylonectria macrodidyma TaxID=307937 RepID=A0A9P9D5F9_9HYPO|nr:hypothetical protein EDB81DRAFT_826693 [Dactylonectria macrodidyma]
MMSYSPPSYTLVHLLESVEPGGFITNIDKLAAAYRYKPPSPKPTISIAELSCSSQDYGSTNDICDQRIRTKFSIDDPDAFFDEAVGIKYTRLWIEKAAVRGDMTYLITEIQGLADTHPIPTAA